MVPGLRDWQKAFAAASPERLFTDWSSFIKQSHAPGFDSLGGRLDAAEQDFTLASPEGAFDVVLNCRAFQGLSNKAKGTAAKRFFAALRPGGVAIMDTINVQGNARNEIEDSLAEAGFYLPFRATEHWYRDQLNATGISYSMVLDRPRVQFNRNNSVKGSMAQWERDQAILDSFTAEYKERKAQEEATVRENCNHPETKVAHVIYPAG